MQEKTPRLAMITFFLPSPLKGRNTSESLSLLNNKRFMRVKQHSSSVVLPPALSDSNWIQFKSQDKVRVILLFFLL